MKRNTAGSLLILCLLIIIGSFCVACSNSIPKQPPAAEPSTPTEVPSPGESATSKTIFLVGEQNFTPISFEKNGQIVGINVEIIRKVFQRMGMTVKLELMPWERCKKMVEDGTADGFFSPFKTPEREKLYHFTGEPLMIEKNVLVVTKDSNIRFNGDIKAMNSYTFGIILGYATLDKYQKDGTITKINTNKTVSEALHKLVAGHGIDIYVNNDLTVKYTAKQEGLSDKLKILDPPFSETPSYLAFTKKRDMSTIAAKFESELKKIKADGTYKKIMDSYIEQ